MNEPFEGFWNRLNSFVANVEVNDAMSEEEKCMILSVCNDQTKVKNLAQPDVSGSLPLTYGDKVKCSMSKDYREFWLGTYIAKHPTKNRHVVLLRARPSLRIEEELETFAYCQRQWQLTLDGLAKFLTD